MHYIKTLKFNFLLSLLLTLLQFTPRNYAQQFIAENLNYVLTDTTKPTQYRRGIELQEGFQSYEEKYSGKNLTEEKRGLFPLQSTGIWTELNPKVPRVDYLGIQFVDKDTGWAVGDLGTLIKSTDGGSSWTVSETNTTTPILKVRSYNGQVVIASGFGGLLLHSTDGGETYTQITSAVTGDLWGLQMINDTLGWACGNANSLTKTTDGGQTWQRIFTPGYTSDYWWIDFMNESYGFIAANGKVLRTIDGGQNWEIIQAGDNYPLFCIDVIDSLHITAAGYGGTGYAAKNVYSSDGGFTWINGQQTTTHEINCIKYVNVDTGYIVMSNIGIWKTTNRGQNWTIAGGIGEYEIQYLEEGRTGYNAGRGLKLWKTEGNYDVWHRMIINDNFADVFFTSEMMGYVAGGTWIGGPVYKTTNGGLNWFGIPNFPINLFTTTLACLTFTDSLTGFAGGAPCRIVKTTNAGVTWNMVSRTGLTDTIGQIKKFFFINPTKGWAVTNRGGILKTTDGGDNWFAQLNVPLSIGFRSIHFVDSLYGWTANNDRPFKTTDGGQNWIQQTNLDFWNSDDIYFVNQDTGWLAQQSSFNASLFKTTNGGADWLEIPEVLGANSFYLFPDSSHWLITGYIFTNYIVYKKYMSYDAGNSWIDISDDVPVGFGGFSTVTNILGYAVGSLGLVLRYNDTTYIPVELISFEGKIDNNKIILNWGTASELNNKGFNIEKSFEKQYWTNIGFVGGKGTTNDINFYSFTDNEIGSRIQYYRLKQQDYDGSYIYSKIVEIEIPINDFSLSQNFPNPANPSTTILYSVPVKSEIKINLYSISGELVKEILKEEKEKGIYNVKVNLSDLSSGVYFYSIKTSTGFISTKKLIIIK